MKRFILMIAFGAIGLALLAGTARTLTARTTGGGLPDDNVQCWHHLWSCAYADDGYGYWSGCMTNAQDGYISTADAKNICEAYHSS